MWQKIHTQNGFISGREPVISQHSFRLPECPTLRGFQFSYF